MIQHRFNTSTNTKQNDSKLVQAEASSNGIYHQCSANGIKMISVHCQTQDQHSGNRHSIVADINHIGNSCLQHQQSAQAHSLQLRNLNNNHNQLIRQQDIYVSQFTTTPPKTYTIPQIQQKHAQQHKSKINQTQVLTANSSQEQSGEQNNKIIQNINRIILCKQQTQSALSQIEVYVQLIQKLRNEQKHQSRLMQQKDIENRKLRDIVHVREMEIVDLKEDRDRLIRLYNTQAAKVRVLRQSIRVYEEERWDTCLREKVQANFADDTIKLEQQEQHKLQQMQLQQKQHIRRRRSGSSKNNSTIYNRINENQQEQQQYYYQAERWSQPVPNTRQRRSDMNYSHFLYDNYGNTPMHDTMSRTLTNAENKPIKSSQVKDMDMGNINSPSLIIMNKKTKEYQKSPHINSQKPHKQDRNVRQYRRNRDQRNVQEQVSGIAHNNPQNYDKLNNINISHLLKQQQNEAPYSKQLYKYNPDYIHAFHGSMDEREHREEEQDENRIKIYSSKGKGNSGKIVRSRETSLLENGNSHSINRQAANASRWAIGKMMQIKQNGRDYNNGRSGGNNKKMRYNKQNEQSTLIN